MERSDYRDAGHIIEIERRSGTSSPGPDRHHVEEGASSSRALSIPQPSSNGANSRNSLSARRSEGNVRRRRHPLKSGIWILIELVFTLSQILASVIVLSFSRHEDHQVFAWAIIYASGCLATLPFLYRRFLHRNQGTEQDSTQTRQDAPPNNPPPEPSTFEAISVLRGTDEEDRQTVVSSGRNAQSVRITARVDIWIPGSQCFFAVWLSVGNFWLIIFGKHYPSAEAPSLYMFSMLFLMICCIVYPWISAISCCCLPCVISIPGFHEDLNHTRGAATETTNVLPTHKFKMKNRNVDDCDANAEGVGEGGGTLAAGTEKERIISGKDADCSICLAKYADNEELKELPCAHFFHVDCVDKWLQKNASCPLCKLGIRENSVNLQT
ncbi:hypothetical protein MKW98_011256 [Papaver atlanticum]|uniref:RING-type domain-containing protein n=1 Tax=Papaver atlanticum TaxID=357466 RepID=A0AAD4SUY6_9MAGN|nr:hypothetical protein MKW98_011256 [Papaver atlanticum]